MTAQALVFPGQGSQKVGMLQEIADKYPLFLSTLQQAEDESGISLIDIGLNGPEDLLNQTTTTQPVLLAFSVALYKVWQDAHNTTVTLTAGHSLGEYSALVAAGAFTLSDAVSLVQRRGELMQRAVPAGQGAMVAVLGADEDLVTRLCTQISAGAQGAVSIANYNSVGQLVLGGDAQAVAQFKTVAAEEGIKKIIDIAVSVPSHTSLMQSIAEEFADRLYSVPIKPLAFPLLQNVNGEITVAVDEVQEGLIRQLYSPVYWRQSMSNAIASGFSQFYECGPGSVLAGLMKRIDRSCTTTSVESVLSK